MKVLIVGSRFGEVYLNAFFEHQEGLTLAGILSTGSVSSQHLAHDFAVPLYTDIEQVPADIDIVCIIVRSTVVGGAGTHLAKHFLQRGCHVIQEHPVHPDDISALQHLALQQGVHYWVNSFYPYTAAGQCWIQNVRLLREQLLQRSPVLYHMYTSRQLLYSSLALFLLSTRAIDIHVSVLPSADQNFNMVLLKWQSETAIIFLQSTLDQQQPDLHSFIMHKQIIVWPDGTLCLESSYGAITWQPTFYFEHNNEKSLSQRRDEIDINEPISQVLITAPQNWRDTFEQEGVQGIIYVLQSLRSVIAGEKIPVDLQPEHQLKVAELWQRILQAVGREKGITGVAPKRVSNQLLQQEDL